MYKFLALISIFLSTHLLANAAAATIPTFPAVWDPNFPLNRCVDFCAFLRPGEICPGEAANIECLCTVYNIRLPACQQCWAAKNSTIGNDLQTVLNFCAQYKNETSSASATATATSAGPTGTAVTTGSAVSGSTSPTATATFASDASIVRGFGLPSIALVAIACAFVGL